MKGGSVRTILATCPPARNIVSVGFTVAAFTRTRTSPSPGSGIGISMTCKFSGPPNSSTPTALMPWTIPAFLLLGVELNEELDPPIEGLQKGSGHDCFASLDTARGQ